MLREGLRGSNVPETIILLTGDGAGYYQGKVETLKLVGWKIELLSWNRSCNVRLRQWVIENGFFTPLDDFYKSVTFVEEPCEGRRGKGRKSTELEELGDDVGRRVRIDFSHMFTLAHENGRVAKAVAAGPVPPERHAVWKKQESQLK